MSIKVLVADDDVVMLSMISTILEKHDFDITKVDDGAKAVEKALAQKFDLIITDIMMPEIEGIEVISEIVDKWPESKIIAISSEGRVGFTSFLKIAETVGATATLQKPFSPDVLLETIESLKIKTGQETPACS